MKYYRGATVDIVWSEGRYRALCQNTGLFVQWPRHLRNEGEVYTADLYVDDCWGRKPFMHYEKGTIRRLETYTVRRFGAVLG